jgi:hypothetical protein
VAGSVTLSQDLAQTVLTIVDKRASVKWLAHDRGSTADRTAIASHDLGGAPLA